MKTTSVYEEYQGVREKEKTGEAPPGAAFSFYRAHKDELNSLRSGRTKPTAAHGDDSTSVYGQYQDLRVKEKDGSAEPGSALSFYQEHKKDLNALWTGAAE